MSYSFYTRTRQEHWLSDKHEDGRVIILEDESMWDVHPSDRPITARWLRMSTIIVEHTQKGDYPYRLKNTTEEEVARANYIGDLAPPKTVAPDVA